MKFRNNILELDKEINELDKFVLRFIEIVKKYTDYVIISGYVSILLGRSRATEDVDLFIRPLDKRRFRDLYSELKKKGFWCLNAEDPDEVYSYLTDKMAVRFAEEGKVIPNFEVKYPKRELDLESFNDKITVKTKIGNLFISSLERQIAFKRYCLKTEKDIEDALFVEKLFPTKLDRPLIERYKKRVESIKKDGSAKIFKKQ